MGVGMTCLLAILASTGAQAAEPSSLDVAPNALRDAALLVAEAVDSGRAAELWREASVVTRDTQSQQAFVEGVAQSRQGLAVPLQRSWTGITVRDVSTQQGNVRSGRYGNVDFSTSFPGNRRTQELVSFRRDEDGQWRFVGYVIQAMP